MKARQVVVGVAASLCCVGGVAACGGSEDKPKVTVPAYTATATKQGADLVAPGVTVDGARAAIGDWVAKNAGDSSYLVVTVVREAKSATYVCRGEYVADEKTASGRTGGRVKGPYPATAMNCPDPKGS